MQRTISQFLVSTAPAALMAVSGSAMAGLLAAAPAYADTSISTGTTQTLKTSTAGNVTVTGTGVLTGSPGAVITVDSGNTVTVATGGIVNAGTPGTAANGAIGIQINPGNTTTITNSGTINVLETFTPTTVNGGFLFSPVSGVSGRFGIYGAAGGTITGAISNTGTSTGVTTAGTINVDGENSAGIEINSVLNGAFNNQGTINVLGDNSYGIKLADVTGKVTIGGTVSVTGAGAQGAVLAGNVAGQVVIDGSVTNNTTYTTSSGTSVTLSNGLLNTNTPVVEIDGNVTGGILVNAPLTGTSTDTNRGTITAYGNSPALQIGGATNVTIGSGTTNNGAYALGIDGSITANSYYSSTPAYGVVIGGRGGNVTLTNGAEVFGTITANTIDGTATALLVNAGSTVGTILNTGTIKATTNQPTGRVFGIQDLSGTVGTLNNQGFVTALGIAPGTSAAIDLRSDTTGVKLTQNYSAANLALETTDKAAATYTPDSATAYAGINGDIYIGTATSAGANTVAIQSGTVNGNAYLGGSNAVTLADTAKWAGNINFLRPGTAQTVTMGDNSRFNGTLVFAANETGTLTINNAAQFLGTVTNGGNLNVVVNGGIFGANAAVQTTIGTLNVASGATLQAYIDGATGTSSKLIASTATFASGAKLGLNIHSLLNLGTPVKYDVVNATTALIGANTLTNSSLSLPVLFSGTISTDANNVYVTLGRASDAQLGLSAAQSAAYTAIVNNAAANDYLGKTLLGIYDAPTLRARFNELLPNYYGGAFDTVTRGSRLAAQHIDNDSSLFSISTAGAWLEPIVFRGTRTYGATPGYKTTGAGISAGVEKTTAVGNVGLTLAYLSGDAKSGTIQSLKTSEISGGVFWRKSAGPLYLWASANVGKEKFKSTRSFFGSFNATSTSLSITNFTYNAAAHWSGWSAALTAGASYTVPLGEHFSLRPRGVIEYDRLKENRYIETGDTPIALTVLSKTSTQTTATGTITAAWSAGPSSHEGRPFTVELEGGRRSWVSGNLGTTTGTFATGDTFSLVGGHLPSAWLGQLSILQGGLDYTWRLGTTVERGSDKGVSYGVRASISIAL